MTHEFIQVDAFTQEPFRGNPAAVMILNSFPEDAWMQAVAAEINLSETAFLVSEGDHYRLRWFTPAIEVKLCGHATLASAHVLWETGQVNAGAECVFETLSGTLRASREGDRIAMAFPRHDPARCDAGESIVRALGIDPVRCARNEFGYFLAELNAEEDVLTCTPDFTALRQGDNLGYIITARSADSRYDFVSRFFAPAAGVDEDPVTGSAHCVLGPYWAERLGKTDLNARQVSARGGEIGVRVESGSVILTGHAVTVITARLIRSR